MLAMTYGKEPTKSAPDCFASAKRNLDFVLHRREENPGRRHQVVPGRRARGRPAETRRLLAHGIRG